jgi:hypothetical protein
LHHELALQQSLASQEEESRKPCLMCLNFSSSVRDYIHDSNSKTCLSPQIACCWAPSISVHLNFIVSGTPWHYTASHGTSRHSTAPHGALQKSGELSEMQVGLRTSGAVEFDFPKTMLKSDCPETSRWLTLIPGLPLRIMVLYAY